MANPAGFNELEIEILRFLKEEFLQKGGWPAHMLAPATQHRDVMAKFGLTHRQYREVIARLETFGLVEAPTIDAPNGVLRISGRVVEICRQIEEESPMRAAEIVRGLVRQHGEDFEIRRGSEITKVRARKAREEPSGRPYLSLLPGTTVQAGEVVRGTVSGDELHILDTDSRMMGGQVIEIKAFYESEAAHQARIAQTAAGSISIGTMTNSAIQQNSPGAVQKLILSQKNSADAAEIIASIVAAIDNLGLPQQQKADLLAETETARAQLKKSNPSRPIIRECLENMKGPLLAAGAEALANGLIEKISALLGQLT